MEIAIDSAEGTTVSQRLVSTSIRWFSASASHVGKVRKINEDAVLDRPDIGLWAVADGVGGESAGDRASSLVVEALGKIGPPTTAAGFLADVRANLEAVNQLLRFEAAADGRDRVIASTVVALLAFGQHFACAWAGDSRLYLWRDGRLQQITRDHSEVQEMVDSGLLTPPEARVHRLANIVTRAVGAGDVLDLDMVQDQVRPEDAFLLCSDGLTKMLEDDEIVALLSDRPLATAVDALIEGALARGAHDNVTVVLVEAMAVQSDE
jgi:serine/threonine protein phosphatase PrpC